MRSLFNFIFKNYFFFLFLLLELIAISFIVQENYYHKAKFINATNAFTGSVQKSLRNFTEYFHLRVVNEQLAEENAFYKNLHESSFIIADKGFKVVDDTLYRQHYQYTPSRIIKNSVHKRNNYLMIDKGEKQGLSRDQGVISPDGIVGIIKETSNNFSGVISVLHMQTRVAVKHKKSGKKGFLTWDGKDHRVGTIVDVPGPLDIQKGDTLLTSGDSRIFPENIMIGTVKDFTEDVGTRFYTIYINFSVDYNTVSYVYVVKNLFKAEQDSLIQITETE